jgi:hypothetical protein
MGKSRKTFDIVSANASLYFRFDWDGGLQERGSLSALKRLLKIGMLLYKPKGSQD